MFFDTEPGPIFRPPSEANSFILRVSVGCSHNVCTYCNMYRTVQFHIKSMDDIKSQINTALSTKVPVKRIFLSDGDALILPTKMLLEILQILYDSFPRLQRVSSYAGPKSILSKTSQDLELLQKAGLKLVYYGIETGDDELLAKVKKGVNAKQAIHAGVLVKNAGIKLSMMVILGLAGKETSNQHALKTAQAINIIKPDMLSALTLMLYRGSELKEEFDRRDLEILSPSGLMQELYEIIDGIDLPSNSHCIFRSNHISNYISLAGILPKDKMQLLQQIKIAQEHLKMMKNVDPYNNVERF